MHYLTLCLVLLMALPATGREVYKWINEEGVVIYSDTFQQDAERIKVDSPRREDVTPGRGGEPVSSESEKGDSDVATGEYQEFAISQPENDETIRSNEGTVTVGLTLSPALMAGHGIQVFVDGNRIGEASLTSTQFTLKELNRGTHSLQAKVVDTSGATLIATDSINFHLRKASIIKP